MFKVGDQNDYGEPNSGPSNINDISSKINGYDREQKNLLSLNPSQQRKNGLDTKSRQGAELEKYQKDIDNDIIDIEISSPILPYSVRVGAVGTHLASTPGEVHLSPLLPRLGRLPYF